MRCVIVLRCFFFSCGFMSDTVLVNNFWFADAIVLIAENEMQLEEMKRGKNNS